MPFANAHGARLHFESIGTGVPIVFVHETAADARGWEAQVRWFSRFYQCITFNARGFAPSDRPADTSGYNYRQYAEDIGSVMDAAGVARAFVVGHSMGAYSTAHFVLNHPERALGIVLAGIGAGSEDVAVFRANAIGMSEALRKGGMDAMARQLAFAPNRVQLHNKDHRGWSEWLRRLRDHDPSGTADALQHFHATRPMLYEFEAAFRDLKVPTLVALGDEDTPCIEPSLFLKRVIPAAGLWICPRTGHAIQLEEPALFNEAVQAFIMSVQQDAWKERDPRTLGSHVFVESSDPLPS